MVHLLVGKFSKFLLLCATPDVMGDDAYGYKWAAEYADRVAEGAPT